MKKMKKNGIILLCISSILLWLILKDNFNESIRLLLSSNLYWVAGAVGTYIIYFLLEAVVLKKLVNQFNDKYSLISSIKLNIATKFFNGITPFATGGQPLQVYQLRKEGVRASKGTIIIVEHFIVFQTSLVILALISLLMNIIFKITYAESFLNYLTIFGFVVNILLLFGVYILCISKKTNKWIVKFGIKLLSKLRIIKDKDNALDKWEKMCDDYYDGYQALKKNKKSILECLSLEILALLFMFAIPIFIFNAIGYHPSMNLWICIIISVYVFFVGSYVPIPGGSGGTEYAFIGFFSHYIGAGFLSPALILWRFITYYLPIIIGGISFNFIKDEN